MDYIIGHFADAQLTALSDPDLDTYESWLDIPDQQFFAWVNGAAEVPADIDTALFRRLRDFHSKGLATP